MRMTGTGFLITLRNRMEEEKKQKSAQQLCAVTRREEGKTRQASVFHLQRTMGGGD